MRALKRQTLDYGKTYKYVDKLLLLNSKTSEHGGHGAKEYFPTRAKLSSAKQAVNVISKLSSRMRNQFIDILALLLVVAVLRTLATHKLSLTSYKDTCELISHELTVERDGCTGKYPVLSCYGRCQSTAKPKFYTDRY